MYPIVALLIQEHCVCLNTDHYDCHEVGMLQCAEKIWDRVGYLDTESRVLYRTAKMIGRDVNRRHTRIEPSRCRKHINNAQFSPGPVVRFWPSKCQRDRIV